MATERTKKSDSCFFFAKKAPPSEKTKDLLLEEAKKHFCEKGYEGASIRHICEAAGANVSAIKYHFGGKEGLYRECFLHFGETRLAQAQKLLTQSNTVEEFQLRIKLFTENFISDALENPHTTKMICREIEIENPLIQDIFESTFLRVYTTLMDFIIDAQNKRIINPDADAQMITSLIFNTITSTLRADHIGEKFFKRTLRNNEYREQFINNLITIVFNGIKIQEQ